MYDLKTMQRALALSTAGLALTAAPALARPDYPLTHVVATPHAQVAPTLDLRSPDAVDAGSIQPRATGSLAGTTSATPVVASSTETAAADDGLDWGSMAIGAGAVAAVALIGLGGVGMAHRARMNPAG